MQRQGKGLAIAVIGAALVALSFGTAWAEAPKRSPRPLARPVLAQPAPEAAPVSPQSIVPVQVLPGPVGMPRIAPAAVPLLALPGRAPLAPAMPPGLLALAGDAAPVAQGRPPARPGGPVAQELAEVVFRPDAALGARPRPVGRPVVAGQPLDGAATPAAVPMAPVGLVAVTGPLAQARPKLRPRELVVAAVAAAAPPVRSGITAQRPKPRPANLARRAAPAAPVITAPQQVMAAAAIRPAPGTGPLTGRRGSVCGIDAIRGETLSPIVGRVQGCGIANPVRITAVAGLRLSQAATMDCETARALNTWIERGLKPAIGKTGGGVQSLQVAGHYVCRTRNHKAGARVSEHGKGRAIDISAIGLANGQSLSILRDWRGPHGSKLKAAHRAACGIFGTTLGPGSDGYHEDHLHFDTARHRSGSYCR